METGDAMLDNKGDVFSENDFSGIVHPDQPQLESAKTGNLPIQQSSEKHLASPNGLRSDANSPTGVTLTDNRIATKKLLNSLQCSRCGKLRRACSGEPGESCKLCIQNKVRCSFLDPRPFRCKPCNRDYSTEAALRGHNTRTHSREISCSVDLDVPGAPHVISSSQSSIQQIPASPSQNVERPETSANCTPSLSCRDSNTHLEQAGSQQRRSPDGIQSVPQSPTFAHRLPLQDPQSETSRSNHRDVSYGKPQYRIFGKDRDHSLPSEETSIPKPYQELNFEIFETYERRNLSPDYVQRTLDGIRDNIDQYGEFVRGKDRDTSIEVREKLRFLDEVRPLIRLPEIDAETSEIYCLPNSRLLIILRRMFAVEDNTRLERALEALGPEVRYLRLPYLICGVLAFYLLQLFTEKDPIREAELRATELTHGATQAANTIQHSRLIAQESHIFRSRLENRAKKLVPSLFDLIRPLTHWQQDSLHNGSAEQHLERLRRIILASLCLAAELEARKGTFSFFWPRSGEQFDPKIHNDEADDSTPERYRNKGRGQKRLIVLTLMPGVVRMMEGKELLYAKAMVIATQPEEQDGF